MLPTADINVTSLVDIAFVLLIIFMITAPLMQGGIELEPYPAIRAWLGRVEALPGFVPMAQANKG